MSYRTNIAFLNFTEIEWLFVAVDPDEWTSYSNKE